MSSSDQSNFNQSDFNQNNDSTHLNLTIPCDLWFKESGQVINIGPSYKAIIFRDIKDIFPNGLIDINRLEEFDDYRLEFNGNNFEVSIKIDEVWQHYRTIKN